MWYVSKIWVHNSFICIQCRNSGSSSSVQEKKRQEGSLHWFFWLARKCVLRINCRNVSSSYKVTRKLNHLLQQLNLTVNVVHEFFFFLYSSSAKILGFFFFWGSSTWLSAWDLLLKSFCLLKMSLGQLRRNLLFHRPNIFLFLTNQAVLTYSFL